MDLLTFWLSRAISRSSGGFDRLAIRMILAKQDELTAIEMRLDGIDRTMSQAGPTTMNNGSFREYPCAGRKHYQRLHEAVSFNITDILRTRPPPRRIDVESVRNWLVHNAPEPAYPNAECVVTLGRPIQDEERRYLDHLELFAVVPDDKSPLQVSSKQSSLS
ncbi:hypothetical protein BDV10DRAFT_189922 [Aspergillus recurvatus]